MKKIPKKSQLPKPELITIKFDPLAKQQEIVMPKINYSVIATVDTEPKFTGEITPIPTILIHFLTHTELKIFSIILEDTYRKGQCCLTVQEIAVRIATTAATISTSLYRMRMRDLLLETPNGLRGSGKIRSINFKALQYLNDLVDGEDPGIYSRIARATLKKSILSLTKEDIRNAYDNKVLPPDHDPAEEEEYD